ncbi:hypothetical protein L1887_01372 [Cichorium endivia]|nr:hypothetical protein L1887_01372 [Cichorium endivia]
MENINRRELGSTSGAVGSSSFVVRGRKRVLEYHVLVCATYLYVSGLQVEMTIGHDGRELGSTSGAVGSSSFVVRGRKRVLEYHVLVCATYLYVSGEFLTTL